MPNPNKKLFSTNEMEMTLKDMVIYTSHTLAKYSAEIARCKDEKCNPGIFSTNHIFAITVFLSVLSFYE